MPYWALINILGTYPNRRFDILSFVQIDVYDIIHICYLHSSVKILFM